jgi:iron complex transport system substrate-binding protein
MAFAIAACGGATGTYQGSADRPSVPPTTAAASAAAFPVTVTDFQGRSVAIATKPGRIVSIGPSNTEFLFALTAGDRVVGVDDFSDQPAAAKSKEKVGGVKVSLEKVASLKADLIVTVKFSDGTLERLAALAPAVLVVDPQSLGDAAKTALLLGRAVGADGAKLATDIDARVNAVRTKTGTAPRPRVFHEVDASDPAKLFTVGPGSFIDELIAVAGGANVAAKASGAYPQLSLEEIVRADPEVVVLGDADYGVTPDQVAARPGWSAIKAVKDRKIFPIADSLVSRPGPRLGEAAEAYAKLLHPELYR